MTLLDFYKSGKPLVVYPLGRQYPDVARIMAALAVDPDAVFFLDTFYNDVGSHTLHFLPGRPRGSCPWVVGEAIFEEIEHGSPFVAMEHMEQDSRNRAPPLQPPRS